MIPYSALPAVDATLNATSAALLASAWVAIGRKRIALHRGLILSACATSLLFLISYLVYHAHAGVHRYPAGKPGRSFYLMLLSTHTLLAVAIVPLVAITLTLGLKRRDAAHRRIARWTMPIWLYVSVTGVVVYWMLYRT